MLDALVRKTEVIQRQLGSAGQVIEKRITDRLAAAGIDRGQAEALAKAIEEETDAERLARARAEMDDDETRPLRAAAEGAEGAAAGARRSRASASASIRTTSSASSALPLPRAGLSLDAARAETVGHTSRPSGSIPRDPAFAQGGRLAGHLRRSARAPRKRGERLNEWRKRAPVRAIAFEPPRLPDGRDAPEVVQVHLEHRLVRRLLSRFLSQGFQAGLSRISVDRGPGRAAARGADGPARGLRRRAPRGCTRRSSR